ncbi:MAG: SDR family NAD(P)-dependent oxidoreductase [Haliea sp.]|jgi:NAD(P)-dependent dehydrogenase (short-subunit alcohol dehydrogenase family)|nr:SDR family NAD(P)-dependent oxidoreductase [Haliea sp.]
MPAHPAFQPGKVAVITGGADGIGLAAARHYQSIGMQVCIADVSQEKLDQARSQLGEVLAVTTDVASMADMERLRDSAFERYGQVNVLMNNAGQAQHNTSWTEHAAWRATLETNLWGVINGIHSFTQAMIDLGEPGVIVNTGSKQGITTPPGNPAYNASKAGVKAVTEALQHDLRNTEGCQLSAHLLVPGFTYTGMVKKFLPEKPDGAWTPEQVVEFMVASLDKGDFYILCPDNDVTREADNKRMAWAIGDLIENRPPLSRWHPDYQEEFDNFMNP